jgi:hypothetical protein
VKPIYLLTSPQLKLRLNIDTPVHPQQKLPSSRYQKYTESPSEASNAFLNEERKKRNYLLLPNPSFLLDYYRLKLSRSILSLKFPKVVKPRKIYIIYLSAS